MNFTKIKLAIITFIFSFALNGCGGSASSIGNGVDAKSTPNFITLYSDAGDYIGNGQTYTYSQSNSQISVSATNGKLTVNIDGDEYWTGEFQLPTNISQLQTGYNGNLQRYPFHNPALGGLNWSGEGRGCNTLTGWFAIDKVTYANGVLTAIDLRFEQHCEGGAPALRGKIHWVSTDTTVPAGPVNPIPAELWQPANGSTPSSGNYIYLKSDAGDYIGLGQTYTYSQSNAQISVSATNGKLSVNINGAEYWTGEFKAMNSIGQLQTGYYGHLQRYPFHNPALGGLDWSGEGRGCNTLTGWFAIDSITYLNGALTAMDLRFEQHCEETATALRGKIHWVSTS